MPTPPHEHDDPEAALDEALDESFPASDPPGSAGSIAPERPRKGRAAKTRE